MSSSPQDFKKLLVFWQVKEINSTINKPSAKFGRSGKRKSKNNQITQSLLKPQNELELHTNNTLDKIVEKNLNPVSNEEWNQKLLKAQSTITEIKTEGDDIITMRVLSSSESSSTYSAFEEEEDKSICKSVIDDGFNQESSDYKDTDQENWSELPFKNHLFNFEDNKIINKADSWLGDNDGCDPCSRKSFHLIQRPLSSIIMPSPEEDSDVNLFDDDWLFQENHIFVFSFAGKPIFSLQRHGYEDKMCSLFAVIQCFISSFEVQQDRILSIEAEGLKIVFLVQNALYFVSASRNTMSECHLELQLREMYNRIGFLLTFGYLNRIFEESPGYDLRHQLDEHFNLISNQLITKTRVSNNIFTLFTDSIRILPLLPSSRSAIVKIIRRKCSKIRKLVFALLIVDEQLIALVRLGNHNIYSSDIRLIFNLLDCLEITFDSMWMLPICLPNFNKDIFLHAYISRISYECKAFLILLSHDDNMSGVLSQTHRQITRALQTYNSVFQQIQTTSQEENGFNLDVINIPQFWHFLVMPKLTNQQLLCSRIKAPYTQLSEFKRLEAIYRDLHHRIHKKSRPLNIIFEVKEKEVALALETDTVEIYAVFDPLVNTVSLASHYVDELFRWISMEQLAYFIQRYPVF